MSQWLCKCCFNFSTKIVNGHITLKVNFAIFSNFPTRVFVFFPPFAVSFLPFLTSNSSSGFLYPIALLSWPRVFLLSVQFKRWMLSSIFSSEWQSQKNKKHVKKMSDVSKETENNKVNKIKEEFCHKWAPPNNSFWYLYFYVIYVDKVIFILLSLVCLLHSLSFHLITYLSNTF